MKKYLLTVLSVVFSITLMGQQNSFTFDDPNLPLRYTVISEGKVEVSARDQNATDIVIPATVTHNSITYTVTEIADEGFKQLHSLQEITIPNTVTIIGQSAFQSTGNNPTEFVVNMGSGVETIGANAFQDCQKLKHIRIPSECREIGANAFADCQNLLEMYIPNPICTLGEYAFARCRSLQNITLPSKLVTIPDGLLMNSDNHLREIVIPESVTSIGSQAFGQVHNAHIIFLGCGDPNTKTITVAYNAFANSNEDLIEFFCTETTGNRSVILNITQNPQNQGGTTTPEGLFGNNLQGFLVPCGMEIYYAVSIYGDNYSQNDLQKINAGELCIAITQQSGDFCDPETWRGYDTWDKKTTYETATNKEAWLDENGYPNFVPRNPMQPFIIDYEITQMGRTPHEVTLKHRRDIYPFNSVNNGILIIDGTSGGQLIERDSLTFNANITLNVNYSIANHDEDIYLIKDYPVKDSTDITDFFDNSNTTTIEDYKKEGDFIRDTKTRYLLSIPQSNNTVIVKDKDYYSTDSDKIYYYGTAATVDANGLIIDYLQNYTESTTNEGFYKDGTSYIKHVFPYNNQTVTVTIERTSGNVTLHGTDYTYGHVRMHQNLAGEIHVKVPAEANKWNFVGAPFNVYDLYAVKLHPGDDADASAVRFDYTTNDWETVLSYGEDTVRPGEGFLAWPFYSGGITFSTKREYGDNVVGGAGTQQVYTDFVLNNDTVYVEKNIADNTNKWMALANPYPAKLCVNAFVKDNTNISYDPYPNPDPEQSNTTIQGQGVYILNATNSSWEFWYKTNSETGFDLGVGQGFFVNVQNSGPNTIEFNKSQIHGYTEPQCEHGVNHSAKSSSQREFIRLSMIADNVASELLFAHNEDAQQYYDIYDANKLFAMERMTEPYFVTDGIKLVKEEVKEVPYYATMNVRSYEEKEVKFRADYIPEGYAVSIIDGEETIDLNPGVEYTTEVSVGENANRFKVLVKKSVGLNDVEELAIDITNSNRIVNISTNETNLQIEVYNALGQKVLSTHSLNFSLNEVSAGAYMIKAFNSKGSKTQKIIIK